ncbi:MAG: bacteriochlorophyll 4-vinyl reductase [Rhizobiaceae bacterium]|nr:bacteriochlorophyll 4-vinyl reductase [Rhizobiaceae bacterium]
MRASLSLDGAAPDHTAIHRVGPNAIIQTRAALDALCGIGARCLIFNAAGLQAWQADDPADMVPADIINQLNSEIGRGLPMAQAQAVMREAGRRTGDYILANRIPAAAQAVLTRLPRRIALRLLLKAVTRNAWTFAGSARVTSGMKGNAGWIAIEGNPICLGRSGFDHCHWHEAVFMRLFEALVSPHVMVRETACMGSGAPACRFEISLPR